LKIIISGYGRMGREVDGMASALGHEVLFRLNAAEEWQKAGEELKTADAVIDFSWPQSAVENIRRAFDLHIPVVTGTTGWYDRIPEVKEWCEAEGQSLFVSANFSIGISMMVHLSEKMAQMLDRFPGYSLSIEEVHHIHKLDAPSGTAIRIAEAVLANSDRKKSWAKEPSEDPAVLHVASRREGEIMGIHILRAESAADRLELTHELKDRKGLASGALLAAEWLQGRKGFFGMKDLLELTD
jgi:4-hydroxy-tetrahydrodipicolinate reductase